MGINAWIDRIARRLGGSRDSLDVPEQMPDAWRRLLIEQVPIYTYLGRDEADRLEQWVLGFIGQIPFEGCSGLDVTDSMRITIAGWASLLVLNREYPKYPYLHRILIYPDGYRIKEGGFFYPEEDTGFDAAGESWDEGYVVLAWSDCLRGIEERNGFNVILHEFAHQLDLEGGGPDGIPVANERQWRRWNRIIERDYERFVRRVDRGADTAMDPYAAEDRAEFFAVATETFFELPDALDQDFPELYRLLCELYGFEPKGWYQDP